MCAVGSMASQWIDIEKGGKLDNNEIALLAALGLGVGGGGVALGAALPKDEAEPTAEELLLLRQAGLI